jgi:hypothetical protein
LLSDFVQLKSDEFVKRFNQKEDAFDTANKIVSLQPGAFGISLNVNELVTGGEGVRRRLLVNSSANS